MLDKITNYLLKEFMKIFLLILVSIFILVFIIDFLEFLPKTETYSIPPFEAIKIVLFRIPVMIENFLQFIILISTVLTLTKISSKSELTVMYSSGISTWKIIKIYSIYVFFIGLLVIFFLNLLFAKLNKISTLTENKYTKYENKYFIENSNGLWFKQPNIKKNTGEVLIRANKVYLEDLIFKNCILIFMENDGFKKRYNVETMYLKNGYWLLDSVYIFKKDKIMNFKKELKLPTQLSKKFVKQQIQNKYEDLDLIPFFSLNKLIKEFKDSGLDIYKFVVKKYILMLTPFMYVLMVFIGILFSNNYQRDNKSVLNIFKTIVFGICIFVIQNTLFELASANKINLLLSTWGFFIFMLMIIYCLLIKKIELQNCY